MNDFMNTYIVLSEMYTESLNENYIFCVKSNIQIANKSEQIILICCVGISYYFWYSHTHTGGRRRLSVNDIWSNRRLRKVTQKRCIAAPVGLYLGETRRFVQIQCLVHQRRRKWWNQACVSSTEVLLQSYREEKAQPFKKSNCINIYRKM